MLHVHVHVLSVHGIFYLFPFLFRLLFTHNVPDGPIARRGRASPSHMGCRGTLPGPSLLLLAATLILSCHFTDTLGAEDTTVEMIGIKLYHYS